MADFIDKIKQGQKVRFAETMEYIARNYHYQQASFSNGLGERRLDNRPGENEGSLKIFSLGRILGLNKQQTLTLFGELYWRDVLENPQGDDHTNIRNFMEFGWEGVALGQNALTPR